MRKLFSISLLLLSSLIAYATHQVSGYISFKCIGGSTYQVTLTDYTNICNTEADRDTLRIYWSDGQPSTLMVRNNGPVVGGFHQGEIIAGCSCRKLNLYTTTHNFYGNGTYSMWIDDQDRMANIVNMTNSINQDFYLTATVTLGIFTGDSVISPIIANPLACIYACGGICYHYNAGAYSPAGDSISYALGKSLIEPGVPAAGYYIPTSTTIDPVTGTLTWCVPPNPTSGQDIFNFVILLTSYHAVGVGNSKHYYPVATVECELEVLVQGNCTNDTPSVAGPSDTCIEAGKTLTLNYTASDADGDVLISNATGDPFSESPPATFFAGTNDPQPLQIRWSTTCAEVRRSPYTVLITTYDLNTPPLDAYKSTDIYVVGPAPEHLVATPLGNTVNLHWNPSICTQVAGYSIYRHTGCDKWVHKVCETGVPAYTGYVLVGTTTGLYDTTFLDNNGGKGLVPGVSYDYMVVANYPLPDGSESYASNDTCVTIQRDVPVLINVSVDSTASSTGKMFVRWTKPLPNPIFDTIANPGPYKYLLLRAKGISGTSFTPIDSVSSLHFNNATLDTTYMDTSLNTAGTGYNYRVDFYSGINRNFKGSSGTASSIYLVVKPDNNELHLSWYSNVPWTDITYNIYRKNPCACPFNLLKTLPGTQNTYTDSNLTNGKDYCYYIESKSAYSDSTIAHPLFDSSEVMCAAPKDTIPPCAPKFWVTPKCNTGVDSLVWENPDHFCPKTDNILLYRIYFTPLSTADVQLIATITNINDTVFVHDSLNSVAGCWSVTAVDSEMYESTIDTICVDNCPEYVLPNVFTPNGDGQNDLFTPLIPYRYIKDIDISIYNRWGQVMFNTIDPKINWDGKDQNTHGECPDGVYYFICQVHEIHVTGIKTRTIHGFVELLR